VAQGCLVALKHVYITCFVLKLIGHSAQTSRVWVLIKSMYSPLTPCVIIGTHTGRNTSAYTTAAVVTTAHTASVP
jgi:hypothetical protein